MPVPGADGKMGMRVKKVTKVTTLKVKGSWLGAVVTFLTLLTL
jgi:hypothetical protein